MTKKQLIYATEVGKGTSKLEAKLKAGYSPTYSVGYLNGSRSVQKRIRAIQDKAIEITGFSTSVAFKDLDDLIKLELGKKNKMSMIAIARLKEMQMKLCGHLIERVEVKTVDLTPAFERMNDRDQAYLTEHVKLPVPVINGIIDPFGETE